MDARNYRGIFTSAATLLLGFLALGCRPASPYLPGFHYVPEPALAVVGHRGEKLEQPAISAYVSIIGVRRGNVQAAVPPAVEVRMRLENHGDVPATFDPSSLQLVPGSLQPFEPAQVRPPHPLQLVRGQPQIISVFFPFPPGMPLRAATESLRLRWEIQIAAQTVDQTVYFERAGPAYYAAY